MPEKANKNPVIRFHSSPTGVLSPLLRCPRELDLKAAHQFSGRESIEDHQCNAVRSQARFHTPVAWPGWTRHKRFRTTALMFMLEPKNEP